MSEWKITTLGQEVDLLTGNPFKSAQYTDDEGDVLLLRGDNIGQGFLRWENAKRWSTEKTEGIEDYFLQEDDVVLAMDRPWIEAGLKFAYLSQDDLPCLLVQRVSRLKAKPKLNQKFLRYVTILRTFFGTVPQGFQSLWFKNRAIFSKLALPLTWKKRSCPRLNQGLSLKSCSNSVRSIDVIQGYEFTQYIIKTQTGTAVPHISGTQIKDFEFLIPPLSEQEEIAKTLGVLDRKISNLRQQNETLEQIAQTLFKHWFVDFEFPNEDGKPYKSSGGEMVRSALGEIPADWRVGKLGDFGKVITGKTPSTQNPNYWGDGLPFITPTDFKNYGKFVLNSEREISNLAVSEFKNLIIPDKSVVVTCIGSDMGKVARTATRCITNQQLNSLVFNQIKNGVEYAYQFLVSQYKMLRLIALGGSTMPIINKTAFSNIEIVIPDFLTLDKFNEIVEPFNLKTINNEQQIQTLTKTRDVLLPQLMSGKLRITE